MKRKVKTAADLIAELNADPSFLKRQQDRERALSEKDAEYRRAEAPLMGALRRVDVDADSVWDLAALQELPPAAMSILLEHLPRPYPQRVREGIARSLTRAEAIEHWEALLRLFVVEADISANGVKWALACALAEAATDDVIDDVIRLVRDARHGACRLALLGALHRSGETRAVGALQEAVAPCSAPASPRSAPERGPGYGAGCHEITMDCMTGGHEGSR